MPEDIRRTDHEPHDYLTGLGQKLLDVLAESDSDVHAVIFLKKEDAHGTAMHIESDEEAVLIVIEHFSALLQTMGKRLAVLPMREG